MSPVLQNAHSIKFWQFFLCRARGKQCKHSEQQNYYQASAALLRYGCAEAGKVLTIAQTYVSMQVTAEDTPAGMLMLQNDSQKVAQSGNMPVGCTDAADTKTTTCYS